MIVDAICPDPQKLQQLLLGQLAASEAETLASHVSSCVVCSDHLAEVPASDALVALLRQPSPILDEVDPKQVKQVVAHLLSTLNFAPDHPDPTASLTDVEHVGPYQILRELGRGGMGVVYLAEDTRLQRCVALKLIRAGLFENPSYVARFEREATILARLKHPNILSVFEVGQYRGNRYLVLEYVPGGTLAAALAAQPPTAKAIAAFLATLAEAVSYAHEHGIIHRDLKPSNILLNRVEPTATELPCSFAELQPKIADFGLARRVGDAELTQSGDLLGTPLYMAPETLGGVNDSPLVDIYSLGAILYECLTGRPPFRGETISDTMDQIRRVDPIALRRLQPNIPRDLETITLKALAKDPLKRYPTAAALAADLGRFLAGQPILARRTGWPEQTLKWGRRNPGWASLLIFVVVGLMILSVGAMQYEARLRQALEGAEKNAVTAKHERENARLNYREARATLEKMLAQVADPKRGDLPRIRELRKEHQQAALAFYLVIASQDDDGGDSEIQWDVAHARLQASLMQIQLGRLDEAKQNLLKATELLQALRVQFPEEERYQRSYAEVLTQRGYLAADEEAIKLLLQARGEIDRLVQTYPNATIYRSDLARLNHALGQKYHLLQQYQEAERFYHRAITLRQDLLREQPYWRDQHLALSQTQANLLNVWHSTKRPRQQLETLINEVVENLDGILTTNPHDAEALIALASAQNNWSYQQMSSGQNQAVVNTLGPILSRLEALLRREPELTEARTLVYSLNGTIAVALDRLSKPAAAAIHYRQVVALAPTSAERLSLRIELIELLLRAGELSAASIELEQCLHDHNRPPDSNHLNSYIASCETLATQRLWGIHPYQHNALAAAKAMLLWCRKEYAPMTWNVWLKQAQQKLEWKTIFTHPEIDALSR